MLIPTFWPVENKARQDKQRDHGEGDIRHVENTKIAKPTLMDQPVADDPICEDECRQGDDKPNALAEW